MKITQSPTPKGAALRVKSPGGPRMPVFACCTNRGCVESDADVAVNGSDKSEGIDEGVITPEAHLGLR